MRYLATLINATGDTYEVPVEAATYEEAQRRAKEQYSYYVQWVRHQPEDDSTGNNDNTKSPAV
jgi:hypothetical protein